MESIAVFIIGLLIGGFLNVCIYRIPRKQSLLFPSSRCCNCGNKILPNHLIPVVSYLLLRGKCPNCRDRISIQYPVVELITGIVYLIMLYKWGWGKEFLYYSFLSSLLIVVTFIDLEHKIIPNKIVLFGSVTGILLALWLGKTISQILLGIVVGFGIMFVVGIISRGGMGGGDVKFAGMLGIYLGWQSIIMTLFLSFLIGGVVGIILIIFKIKGRKDYVPFGPFMSLAALMTVLWGYGMLSWYVGFL